MTVTVVIPCYNEERYLGGCLTALSRQTLKPDQIIVVDNRSRDRSRHIAARYAVRIITETRQGMIFARNTGFNACRTTIIARCDADSRPPTDWVANICRFFETTASDAGSGPIGFYDLPNRSIFPSVIYQRLATLYQRYPPLIGPNMFLRRSIWEKVKDTVCTQEEHVHEDIDLAIHIHQAGGKIGFTRDVINYASARRMKRRPLSFFGEYPVRLIKTWRHHSV